MNADLLHVLLRFERPGALVTEGSGFGCRSWSVVGEIPLAGRSVRPVATVIEALRARHLTGRARKGARGSR